MQSPLAGLPLPAPAATSSRRPPSPVPWNPPRGNSFLKHSAQTSLHLQRGSFPTFSHPCCFWHSQLALPLPACKRFIQSAEGRAARGDWHDLYRFHFLHTVQCCIRYPCFDSPCRAPSRANAATSGLLSSCQAIASSLSDCSFGKMVCVSC